MFGLGSAFFLSFDYPPSEFQKNIGYESSDTGSQETVLLEDDSGTQKSWDKSRVSVNTTAVLVQHSAGSDSAFAGSNLNAEQVTKRDGVARQASYKSELLKTSDDPLKPNSSLPATAAFSAKTPDIESVSGDYPIPSKARSTDPDETDSNSEAGSIGTISDDANNQTLPGEIFPPAILGIDPVGSGTLEPVQEAGLETVEEEFVQAVGGVFPETREELKNWNDSRIRSDAQFRAKFGYAAFLDFSMRAYRREAGR